VNKLPLGKILRMLRRQLDIVTVNRGTRHRWRLRA